MKKMLNDSQLAHSIGEDIWVIHYFLSESEILYIRNKLDSAQDSEWHCNQNHCQLYLNEDLDNITDRVQNLLPDGLFLHRLDGVTRLKINQGHGIHSDNHDFLPIREFSKTLNDDQPFMLVDDNVYGMIIYLNNDYDGGEIFYTKQGIVYKPLPGDLLIHSAEDHCEHGVNPVKTNVRYSISSSIRKKIKIPCQ